LIIREFYPKLTLCYYAAPPRVRNGILLLFSFLFYAWGGVSYSIILVISVLTNFIFVRQIAKSGKFKKRWLQAGIVFNIVLLGLFKYLDFLIENINFISNISTDTPVMIGSLGIVLPLGISFFTFQQMSMLWDVYRDEPEELPRFGQTALYISFFPQLIAGPIVRYHDIIDQIRNRSEKLDLFVSGIRKFIIGLFKKMVIANTCAAIADSIFIQDVEMISIGMTWLAAVAYAFQIYFDFSGYSDMAIGLGRMFGFRILENFNFPYIARSIQDFWRRWHISLSTWFRDYLYIPLGGNRGGRLRTYVNLFIVFFLTGLWHGATWSFVFWGLFHGLFLVIERLGFAKILKRLPAPISVVRIRVVSHRRAL
jgi:alginate O-acetyltransferase complex protein AlgI